jgi:hypothetical protein
LTRFFDKKKLATVFKSTFQPLTDYPNRPAQDRTKLAGTSFRAAFKKALFLRPREFRTAHDKHASG